jgi:phosphoribosylformylglycinamidine synthase
MQITDKTIEEHGLSKDEYEKILEVLGREPNMVELGVFSVMWSEHCSYKSSRVHLSKFPTTGPDVIQGPGENAGVVDIGGGLAAVFKMESHNHPSFIEPYQGAATGVGGIMRDVFTMGARPVASLNSLRFGSFEHPKTAYLVKGVTAGIAGYGNCMGVPTVGGEVYFNDCYNGNNLVNAMTVGIVAKDKIFLGKASGVGNPVIYVGSKTGRDGIHGATMASDVFGEGGEERRPTVQVGDPFAEKLLLEACLELFKTDYVVGIQDMGAAGLTSSSVEMASRAGTGIEIDIDKVPRRETGMSAYEVLLSESQERMLVVVREGVEGAVKEIFDKWDLDAHIIGSVVEGDAIRIIEGGRVVADIPVAALTDAAPRYERPIERPSWQDELNSLDMDALPEPADYKGALVRLLGDGDIASKRWIFRQYDHMVRTDTVVEPGSDAAVVRVKDTDTALAMTVDCNSIYCYIDPFKGGAMAVAEAARNLVVSGARPLALTDCLNFGNPERPEVMWQFRESVLGISEACRVLSIPVIGGNVSFYNETSGDAIHPTPTIGMVGLIDNLKDVTRQFFLNPGDVVALIGPLRGPNRLGGSAFLRVLYGLEKGLLPDMDLEMEKKVQEACLKAIKAGIISSSHDVSEGGLGVALAECCFNPAGPIGASVEVDTKGVRADLLLFNEAPSRIIVSLKPEDVGALEEICTGAGAALEVIGTVGGDTLRINRLIDAPVLELRKAWSGALEGFLSS